MSHDRFAPIRKGLLEFLILKIVAADKVYVADILQPAERHRIRHAGRHAVSPPQQDAPGRPARLRVAGIRTRGPRASTTSSRPRAGRSSPSSTTTGNTSTRRSRSLDGSHAESHQHQPERTRLPGRRGGLRCAPRLPRRRGGRARWQSRSRGDHRRSRAGDRRPVPASSSARTSRSLRPAKSSRSSRRWVRSSRRGATSRVRIQRRPGGGHGAARTGAASLQDPGGRDDRRRLQRPRRVLRASTPPGPGSGSLSRRYSPRAPPSSATSS